MLPVADPVVVSLPLRGPCLVQNSPARRVPSHGTHLMATTYAIDLVPVDDQGRSARSRDWRTLLATEPPERFVGYGQPVLAPAEGTVVQVHDGEPDHEARRSQLTLIPYAFGQAGRLRQGAAGLAGNYVVIRLAEGRGYVALVHLKRGSPAVAPGDAVRTGDVLAACGNSGNSTEPHLHLQVMDGPDPMTARGVPVLFDRFTQQHRGKTKTVVQALPSEGAIIQTTA